MQPRHKHELQCNSGLRATVIYGDKIWVRGHWKCKTSDLILLSKYRRRPDAWNKHAVPHLESEAASFSAGTAHLFGLIPWLLELDRSTQTPIQKKDENIIRKWNFSVISKRQSSRLKDKCAKKNTHRKQASCWSTLLRFLGSPPFTTHPFTCSLSASGNPAWAGSSLHGSQSRHVMARYHRARLHSFVEQDRLSIFWEPWSHTDPLLMDCRCHQFSSVQSLSHVQLFLTPWTAAS